MTGLVSTRLAAAQETPTEERRPHGAGLDAASCETRLPELEKQYEAAPSSELLYDIGRCSVELQDYVRAASTFSSYLEAGESIPQQRREEIAALIAKIEPRIAKINVACNIGGVDVKVDGKCAVDATSRQPVCVARESDRVILANPGEHQLTVSHAGYRPIVHHLTVGPGEDLRVRVNAGQPSGPENPYRDTMWTAWAVTGGAAVAAGVIGIRTGLAGDGFGTTTGIATIVLGGATLVAAGVATYFTVRTSRWKPPAVAELYGAGLRF